MEPDHPRGTFENRELARADRWALYGVLFIVAVTVAGIIYYLVSE